MPNDDFTVMLDKREGHGVRGAELGGAVLRGKSIFKEGSTGLADSIDAVIDSDLIHVPTYRLIGGRAHVCNDNESWLQYHDSNAEKITAYDEKGILGKKETVYALDIQNGGLFVWNPGRIRNAVKGEGEKLVNGALQLSQEEVNGVLDAIKREDFEALKQMVHGRDVVFAGDYNGFAEASASPGFLKGMDATYLVVRPAEEARKLYSGMQDIKEQRENPDLVIASGGKLPLGKMIDKAAGFKWTQFGSWHDGYKTNNTGRVVYLDGDSIGVYGSIDLSSLGRSVGVAPEALDAFYNQKNCDPLALKVNEAMRTLKPVQHGDGVVLYVPSVHVNP